MNYLNQFPNLKKIELVIMMSITNPNYEFLLSFSPEITYLHESANIGRRDKETITPFFYMYAYT